MTRTPARGAVRAWLETWRPPGRGCDAITAPGARPQRRPAGRPALPGSRRPRTRSTSTPAGADGAIAGGGRPTGRGRPGGAETAEEPRDESELAREICLRQLAVRPRTRAELAKALRPQGDLRRGDRARCSTGTTRSASSTTRPSPAPGCPAGTTAGAWPAGRWPTSCASAASTPRTAGEALEDLDDDTEAATARALVDRKLRTVGRHTRGGRSAAWSAMLARKGYPPGVAIRAVKDALAARSAEAAEFADQIDADALADAAGDGRSTADLSRGGSTRAVAVRDLRTRSCPVPPARRSGTHPVGRSLVASLLVANDPSPWRPESGERDHPEHGAAEPTTWLGQSEPPAYTTYAGSDGGLLSSRLSGHPHSRPPERRHRTRRRPPTSPGTAALLVGCRSSRGSDRRG